MTEHEIAVSCLAGCRTWIDRALSFTSQLARFPEAPGGVEGKTFEQPKIPDTIRKMPGEASSRVITLNGSDWTNQDDFYDCLFQGIQAPHWHGRNIDALNDSIGTGEMNKIELPYHIRIRGLGSMGADARKIVERFERLIHNLQSQGKPVSIELSE